MNILRACALATAVLAGPLAAQRADPPAPQKPATSAFLLGTGCDVCGRNMYLVVREGSRVRLATRGPGLLVPRKDGFWWLDWRNGASGWEGRPEPDCPDTIPPDTVPHESDLPEGEYAPTLIQATPAGEAAGAPRTDTLDGGELSVFWVGGEWMSTNLETVGRLGHLYGAASVIQLPGLVRDSAAARPFDPYHRGVDAEIDRCGKRAAAEAVWPRVDDFEWIVRRRSTRWALVVVPGGSALGFQCDLPRRAGAPLFGPDSVTVPWHAIKDVLPGATTAFESPGHDLLLVLQDSTLYAFLPQGPRPGRPLARFRVVGQPLLAQWAVGAHAARWAREVPALLRRGPPDIR